MLRLTQFVAAFVPINFLVWMRAWQQEFVVGAWIFASLFVIGILLNILIIGRMLRRTDGEYYTINKYKLAEDNIAFYIVSIAPIFLSAKFEDYFDLIVFFTIYGLVATICILSKYVNVNPILYLFGIRYFEAEVSLLDCDKSVFIVSTISSMRSNRRMRLARMKGSDWFFGLES